MTRVRIWDLPTRVFHWLFAAACATAWLSGDEPRYTDLHLYAGYLALGLLLFRLVWGLFGGRYARFSQFVRGPAALREHLRQLFEPGRDHEPGHNPAGGWAILAMLGLALLLGLSGLAVLGGEEGFGPLAGLFGIEQGVAVHRWHEWLAWALLAVVALHLGGVALESLLQRQNLPRAMLTGMKSAPAGNAEARNSAAIGWGALVAAALFSAIWFAPYLEADEAQPYRPFIGAALVDNAQWQESCGECHLAYHPSLLPARSWQRMLDEQNRHFGEDLYLAPETLAALSEYAERNSAERVAREVSWRTLRSLGGEERPLRITATPYWKQVHRDIDTDVWERPSVNGRLDCAACHRDAGEGGFMNGAMHIPD